VFLRLHLRQGIKKIFIHTTWNEHNRLFVLSLSGCYILRVRSHVLSLHLGSPYTKRPNILVLGFIYKQENAEDSSQITRFQRLFQVVQPLESWQPATRKNHWCFFSICSAQILRLLVDASWHSHPVSKRYFMSSPISVLWPGSKQNEAGNAFHSNFKLLLVRTVPLNSTRNYTHQVAPSSISSSSECLLDKIILHPI